MIACSIFLSAVFTNLTLQQAEQIALSQNKDVLIADMEMGQQRAKNFQSILAWLPDITFESMYVDMQKQQSAFFNRLPKSYVMNQIVLTQPIFSTDLIYALRASSLYLDSTGSKQQAVVNDTLLQLRIAYFGVILSELSLGVQDEVICYLKEALGDEEKKLEAGKSTEFEVNQAKVELSQASNTYHTLVKSLKLAKNQLILSLGAPTDKAVAISVAEKKLPLEEYPDIEGKLKLLDQMTGSLGALLPSVQEARAKPAASLFTEEEIENWVRVGRQRRPDLRKAAQLAKITREGIRSQQGDYFPKISGFIDYGYYKPMNGLFIEQQYNWAGGVKLSWNIFDSCRREFKIKEAQFAHYAANFNVEQMMEKGDIAIRSDIDQFEEALFAYAAAKEAENLAAQGLKEAKVRQRAGTISQLQFRDATRLWAEARRSVDRARFSILDAYFRLRHDAGSDVS